MLGRDNEFVCKSCHIYDEANLIPQPNLSEVRYVWVVSPCPYVKPLTRLNAGLTTIAVPPGLLTCAVSPTRHMFLVLYVGFYSHCILASTR